MLNVTPTFWILVSCFLINQSAHFEKKEAASTVSQFSSWLLAAKVFKPFKPMFFRDTCGNNFEGFQQNLWEWSEQEELSATSEPAATAGVKLQQLRKRNSIGTRLRPDGLFPLRSLRQPKSERVQFCVGNFLRAAHLVCRRLSM